MCPVPIHVRVCARSGAARRRPTWPTGGRQEHGAHCAWRLHSLDSADGGGERSAASDVPVLGIFHCNWCSRDANVRRCRRKSSIFTPSTTLPCCVSTRGRFACRITRRCRRLSFRTPCWPRCDPLPAARRWCQQAVRDASSCGRAQGDECEFVGLSARKTGGIVAQMTTVTEVRAFEGCEVPSIPRFCATNEDVRSPATLAAVTTLCRQLP